MRGPSAFRGSRLLQGGGGSITEAELLSEYTEETLSMITSGSSVESTNARMVTAFIRSRGQGMIDGEWQDLADWELEDTKNLPRKAIAKVVEFIAEEQNTETQEAMAAKKAMKRLLPNRAPNNSEEITAKIRAISEFRTIRTSMAPAAKGKR